MTTSDRPRGRLFSLLVGVTSLLASAALYLSIVGLLENSRTDERVVRLERPTTHELANRIRFGLRKCEREPSCIRELERFLARHVLVVNGAATRAGRSATGHRARTGARRQTHAPGTRSPATATPGPSTPAPPPAPGASAGQPQPPQPQPDPLRPFPAPLVPSLPSVPQVCVDVTVAGVCVG